MPQYFGLEADITTGSTPEKMTPELGRKIAEEINARGIAAAGCTFRGGECEVWFWPSDIYHKEFKQLMAICERYGTEMRYEEYHGEGGEFKLYIPK